MGFGSFVGHFMFWVTRHGSNGILECRLRRSGRVSGKDRVSESEGDPPPRGFAAFRAVSQRGHAAAVSSRVKASPGDATLAPPAALHDSDVHHAMQ